MNASKLLNPLTISIAGLLLTVVAGVLIYMLLIKNTNASLDAETADYQSNVQYEDPLQKAQAVKSVKDAQTQVQQVTASWNQIQYTKNPDIDYSDVMTAWNQYIDELNFKLAPSIEQWMPSTGIKPTAPITTPAPPADPNAVVAFNPIVIPLNSGSPINVVGTFPQILHHVAAWNNFNRIVLIDKLQLAGISPWVTGSYTATVYEFPRNADKPGVSVPSSATATAAGGVAGGQTAGPQGSPSGLTPPRSTAGG